MIDFSYYIDFPVYLVAEGGMKRQGLSLDESMSTKNLLF